MASVGMLEIIKTSMVCIMQQNKGVEKRKEDYYVNK